MRSQTPIYSRYFTYIKPFTKLPIVKTYGSTIFTFLVMMIFILFAIKPTFQTILILQKQLANSNQILDKLNQKTITLDKAKQNFENLDPNIKSKIAAAIPDASTLRSVIQVLEKAAADHDASVSALQIQPQVFETKISTGSGTISEIPFTFNATGEYKNIILLLEDLKASNRLIAIDNLSLSKLSEGTSLIISITGKAYYIK